MTSLNGSESSRAPANDELEVSIFGPGYGETILVHLGFGDWLIVDSCIDRNTRLPTSISYLRKLGINPGSAVKIILASHWHDDHVRGLASVFEECELAEFFCSPSLLNKEFLQLVRAVGTHSIDPGVQEFAKIINFLTNRITSGRKEAKGPRWALENTRIWQRNHPSFPAEIFALSPSSASLTLSFNEISQLIPTAGQQKRRVVALTPNHAAVVLCVIVGSQSIILGSDLEETTDQATGWSVIVDSTARPNGKAQVFKIPHHGSANGHYDRVWSEMLDDAPFVVLTPFINGGVALPTKQDVHRIGQWTPNAFSTSQLRITQQKRRRGALDRTIKDVVRSIRTIPNTPGQVRLRKSLSNAGDSWGVELIDGAVKLSEAVI